MACSLSESQAWKTHSKKVGQEGWYLTVFQELSHSFYHKQACVPPEWPKGNGDPRHHWSTFSISVARASWKWKPTVATTHIFIRPVLLLLLCQPWSPFYVDPQAIQGLQHFPHKDTTSVGAFSGHYILPKPYQKFTWPVSLLSQVAPGHWDGNDQSIHT